MKYKIFSNASTDKNRDRLQFVYFNSINLIVSLLYKGKLKGLLDSARQFYYGGPSQLRAQSFTPLNTQNKINYQFCPSNRVPLPPIKICLIETNKNSVSKHSILVNLPSINIPRDKRTRINFAKLDLLKNLCLSNLLPIIIKTISKLNSIKYLLNLYLHP